MNLISYIPQPRRSPSKPDRLKKHSRYGRAAMEISGPLLPYRPRPKVPHCILNAVAMIWLGLKHTPTSAYKPQIYSQIPLVLMQRYNWKT